MSENNYNRLINETSSYLAQHKNNPVHWYSYGPEALQRAQEEDKPIFLSIGYSSCHWCHVMGHESFEDQEIADLLNEKFINIKVDREELPDLDSYYQLACQVMNGRGGWPLSVFLTADMKPYFVGTYFPKVGSEGAPSFKEIITNMSRAYHEERETVNTNANQITDALKQPPQVEHKVDFQGHYPAAAAILNAITNYQDNEFGGYGQEPKFPHFSFLEWATEHMLEGMVPEEFGSHIIKTVEMMLMGGIIDHARGGVHRYSVDQKWKVPHFEKMLYDQAGFLRLLTKMSLFYPSPLVFDSLIQTLDYLRSEMLSDEGFFFSAQDADSEGVEGLYFTFNKDEFCDAIVQFDESLADKTDTFMKWFDITEEGNFDHKLNIVSLASEHKEEFYTPEGWSEVRKIRQALLETRKTRIPPQTDRKGIASWNFQTLSALMEVIHYCKIDAIKQSALELLNASLNGIQNTFVTTDEKGRSRIKTSTTREGHAPQFEDYVFFADFNFKAYELFADENFLENAKNTVQFIFDEFYSNDIFFTRAVNFSEHFSYDNIHTPIFDQSYKSPLGNLILLLRKWSTTFSEYKEFLAQIEKTIHNLTHLSLQNPLAFGETLRALVYPEEAYRKIEVPKTWLENKSLQPFLLNFSSRFALSYHADRGEQWQICTTTECELQGETVEEFAKVFTPPQEPANKPEK